MSRPRLFFHLLDQSIETSLLQSDAAKNFLMAKSNHFDSWVEQLINDPCDVAVVEVDRFSKRDCERFTSSVELADLEFLFLSRGEPNPDLDKVMMTSAGYHFRAPFEFSALDDALNDILEDIQSNEENAKQVKTSDLAQYGLLVGSSKPMRKLYRTVRKVANTDANVLIIGESGAGKELVANTIHLASERAEEPFVAINCGALSPELVDSELFGHVKGSFTGAHKDHEGVFSQADKGTLFLDEVTEMPIEHQVKLLRVLESGEYRPVGSDKVRHAKARIVAATNRDPSEAIRDELFREDLFFRLSQFPINIPPLRDRGDDIAGLAIHFLAYRNANDSQAKSMSEDALNMIRKHFWPGNVRELKHVIERAFILADDVILPQHIVLDELESTSETTTDSIPAGLPLEEIEEIAIKKTLEVNDGNKTETADQLGISIKTLYNKLDKYTDED